MDNSDVRACLHVVKEICSSRSEVSDASSVGRSCFTWYPIHTTHGTTEHIGPRSEGIAFQPRPVLQRAEKVTCMCILAVRMLLDGRVGGSILSERAPNGPRAKVLATKVLSTMYDHASRSLLAPLQTVSFNPERGWHTSQSSCVP